jgi:TonB family protein
MAVNYTPGRTNFGLLPEPERSAASFVASMFVNGAILGLAIFVGATAKKAIDAHRYEETILIVPNTPPPPPPPKVIKVPEQPKIDQPKLPEVKMEPPKIKMPKPEPKPDLKPIEMEAKVVTPEFKAITPKVKEAPQPKAAITAAMPAQSPDVKPSTKQVHLGDTFGVTPNPNATRPATIASIGNPYGGQQGPAVAPHGVVGSTGIGNGTKSGSGGSPGAYAGVKVASAGIPNQEAVKPVQQQQAAATTVPIEVISKPPVQYTAEARALRIEGDVVLRVTFTAGGQVIVQSVVHGLGHGLDEEARRVAQLIRFHPATRNGQSVDSTTNIIITFQLA